VNFSRFPLRINIGFLINAPVGTNRDFEFELPTLRYHPDQEFHDFKGTARVTRTQQGLFVQGDFETTVTSECVRCLAEFVQPLQTTFSELYAFDQRSITESNLLVPPDGYIDLGPLVREYLILEIPIRPICREDCKGLCPICGEDWNASTCEHQHGSSSQD
jgi:uncharacterized protein